MYLLKSFSITHNAVLHVLYRFFLVLQIICAVVLLSFPLSYANEHGATVFSVPVAIDDFPDSQEKLETLLHHKTGLKEPCVYKHKVPKCFKNIMQLTPHWLKTHYGTSPLSYVKKESATQVQLAPYSLSQAIELIESDECQDAVSFVSVLDKKIASTLETYNQLSSLPFLGTGKFLFNFLEFESFLCPLNYEEQQVPITFSISFNQWQKMFQHHTSTKKTKRQLSYMHKKFQSTLDKTSLTLPNHIAFLKISNKYHVEHLHQKIVDVSSVIVQTHGRQKVVLMPPISEQHPHHHWLDLTGQFFLNQEIHLSASDIVLNNEQRLAHATLYSVHLNPGDMLLVPANWFIYQKSLSTSISMSLNYLSGHQWRFFCSQAEPMEPKHEHEYLTLEKRAVTEWMHMEIQHYPHNKYNIMNACKSIQAAISDATQQVLDLSHLQLRTLPDAIFRIPHIETLDLSYNKLTSFSLSHMKNLVSLNLAYNKLTSFSFNHMEKLVSLDLSYNKLTSFSLNHMENLALLNLKWNKLTSFSSKQVENLASLDLSGNALTSFSLSHMKNLKSLNLKWNQLTSFFLSHMPKLDSLDLQDNRLLSFSLRHVKNLSLLNLSCNELTFFSSRHMKNLSLLNLACNKFTSFSLSHMPKLDSLNLQYNQLISISLNHMLKLTSLDLQDNQLISFSFYNMKYLKSLNLSNNKLPSFSLNHVDNLTSLNLEHNQLTSFSLSPVENLVSLNLARNQLTSFSLSHMQALDLLNLSYNQLSSFLSYDLFNVKRINLYNNHLSHLDSNCISSIHTHQLIILDLRNNPLSNEGKIQIQKDLLQRSGDHVIYYPILHPLIRHIQQNTMTYKNFIHLLFCNNMFPSSENDCLICPIICANPSQVIFFMSSNKCYKIYDADALIQWIRTQSQSKKFNDKIQDPYTRSPLTFNNLMSAKELCVLQYLQQELGSVSTEST